MWTREETQALVMRADDPPTLPERFAEIRQVVEHDEAGAAELAEVVRKDQATSAMILKMANSAFYNPRGQSIASITDAVARLGFSTAAHVAMTMSLLYGVFAPVGVWHAKRLWTHAWCVGLLAEGLARRRGWDAEAGFTAGLLHDIGRVLLASRVDIDYFDALGPLWGDELVEAERKRYGADHAEVGGWAAELWRLPGTVAECIASHHEPCHREARALTVADRLAHERIPEDLPFEEAPRAVAELLAGFGRPDA